MDIKQLSIKPELIPSGSFCKKFHKEKGIEILPEDISFVREKEPIEREPEEKEIIPDKEDPGSLIGNLDGKKKELILYLLGSGMITDKEILSLLEDDKESPLYMIPDLTEESRKTLLDYIKANNLSKTGVKAILSNDHDRREIEEMVLEHFSKEREEVRDLCLNMWAEGQKAQKNRLKFLCALFDELNKIDGEIWSHRCKTNQEISELYYKALIGT